MGRRQEIIEIGALKLDQFGESIESYQAFVRPVEHPRLSTYCRQLTGISQTDVQSAKTFHSTCRDFVQWIDEDSDFLLCSWGDKDMTLLRDDCLAHRIDQDWLSDYIDIKAQYHHLRGFSKKRGLKKVLSHEGLDFEGQHHRALDDASNLASLFIRHLDTWQF